MSKKSKHVWTDDDDIEFGKAFGEWVKRADKKHDTVDWEKLCKQLQEALANEMKENEDLDRMLIDAQIEVIQASGIIKYLEKCISDYMDIVNGNESV